MFESPKRHHFLRHFTRTPSAPSTGALPADNGAAGPRASPTFANSSPGERYSLPALDAPFIDDRKISGCGLRRAPIGRMLYEGTGGEPARWRQNGCWNYPMSRACFAFLALIAVFIEPVEAGGRISHLHDRSAMASAYVAESDLVTAYTTGMARIRLKLTGRSGETDLAVPLEPTLLRAEFRARTWRAADGSLLQGFAGTGGFRLTLGNCLARMCAASECSDAGWPVFSCSDGRKRKMSATDFCHRSFRRRLLPTIERCRFSAVGRRDDRINDPSQQGLHLRAVTKNPGHSRAGVFAS